MVPPKSGLNAFRSSLFAFREKPVDAGRRYAFGNNAKRTGDFAPVTVNRRWGLRPEAVERETPLPNYEGGGGRQRKARVFGGILRGVPVLGKALVRLARGARCAQASGREE